MADPDPELPPLLGEPPTDFKQPALPVMRRKRSRNSEDVISSDPALFSSDDLSEAAENYTCARFKRVRAGPWWTELAHGQEHPAGERREKRQFTRNLDSGVWMGSDGTDVSEEDISAGALGQDAADLSAGVTTLPGLWAGRTAFRAAASPPQKPSGSLGAARPGVSDQSAEELEDRRGRDVAENIVQTCVETGKEDVDLSSLGLTAVPPLLLQSLNYLTKWPVENNIKSRDDEEEPAPSQESSFAPLVPDIRLFLSTNLLRTVPKEIFDIERLTLLSLRNNQLTRLPPAIGKLQNLRELNVAGNRLSYLPFDVLNLVNKKLKRLHVYPNPFIETTEPFLEPRGGEVDMFDQRFDMNEPDSDVSSDGVLDPLSGKGRQIWKPSRVARGAVVYFSIFGHPVRDRNGSAIVGSATSPELAQPGALDPDQLVDTSTASRAPSLLDLTLQRCTDLPAFSSLPSSSNLFPTDTDTSPDVLRAIDIAKAVKDDGGRLCSVCRRRFVIPRVEWIEWWDCIPPSDLKKPTLIGSVPPLLLQGCSWRCVPDPIDQIK